MPKLTIDQREVEVHDGATILDAARKLGIDIPALCFREGCDASTSCLVCTVRINGQDRLVPSCATAVADGMQVESESESVHRARCTALELLLSDHLGDCVAPCQFGCPAEMDIPTMLRQIAAGELRGAIATVKRDIALPAILGRICSAPCEKVCRRGDLDAPVSICLLKRLAADVDLASADPYTPICMPATGKRVAIVGAGPTGLSAAYYLRQFGHACTLFDENSQAGGRLLGEAALPREVLQAEIATITRLGIDLELGKRILSPLPLGEGTGAVAISDLLARFDAVLLACGATSHEQAQGWGLPTTQRGIGIKPRTYETGLAGVFAAGNAVRGKALVVRSAADGHEAAIAIDQFVSGRPVIGRTEPLSTKIGRMHGDELAQFAAGASKAARQEPVAGLTLAEGVEQASRCLHCDCRGQTSCKLRKYAAIYNAHPKRFLLHTVLNEANRCDMGTECVISGRSQYKADRRVFQQNAQHAEVIYEPGKCIDCGLCIQIAAAAGEPLGLTFVGRGFDVRVAVPLDRPLSEALTKVAAECVAACPTAALAWKRD